MTQVVVQQTPAPPMPPLPDPNLVFTGIMEWVGPLAVMIVVVIGLRWLFRSPVGEAIAESIRHASRQRRGVPGESGEQVAALEAQVASLRSEVSDLAERLDFAERVLAERREQRLGTGQ